MIVQAQQQEILLEVLIKQAQTEPVSAVVAAMEEEVEGDQVETAEGLPVAGMGFGNDMVFEY